MAKITGDSLGSIIQQTMCSQHKIDTLYIKTMSEAGGQGGDSSEILGLPENIAKILLPVLVTIAIFLLTQLIAWAKKKLEKREEISSYRNIITQWVTLIERPVTQQITACREFATRLHNSTNIHPEAFSYNKFQVDKVEAISVDKYISAFVTNSTGIAEENYRMTFRLISQFNFLRNTEAEMPNIYKIYQEQTFEIMEEWNVNFRSLDDLISKQSVLIRTNPGHVTTPFHNQIVAISNAWLQGAPNGRSEVTATMTNLVTPMTTVVRAELTAHPGNDYAFNLSACLQELRITHLKWESNSQGYETVFNQLADGIQQAYNGLIAGRNHFTNGTRLRYFWRIR